jgi:hypothetical protein
MGTRHRIGARGLLATVAAACLLLLLPGRVSAELRISNLSVFLNDLDVTVHVVLLGALPEGLHEGLHSGIAAHVRLLVELRQLNRFLPDRQIQARTIERQVTYNPLTKEYKVASLQGEQRESYLTKDLYDAQRVVSEHRVRGLAPASSLDPKALYYVQVRGDVSLGGVNSWFARLTGNAEETSWTQSSLLTLSRSR